MGCFGDGVKTQSAHEVGCFGDGVKTQRLIRTSGAQDEPYTLPPGELPPAALAAGAPLPKNVTFNIGSRRGH